MAKKSNKINNYLRLYRKKNGLSQKDIAYLMGFKTSTSISNYERGNKLPQLINLLKLEIVYRTPIAFLFKDHLDQLKKEIQEKEKSLKRRSRNKGS